jgi:hypothetical protein
MRDFEAVHARLKAMLTSYEDPTLATLLSPELARRRQGKACFNFTRVDEKLLGELGDLTARAIPGFKERAEAPATRRR